MRRRDFIAGLGGAAAWPLAAHGQQSDRMRRIGILQLGSSRTAVRSVGQIQLEAFKRGLAELGWIEGRNIRFEERWADDNLQLLPIYAAELARLTPDAIFVSNSPTLREMRQATSEIPIVFAAVADPVGQGFVSSLALPGGNITGFVSREFGLATKTLELLKKVAPAVEHVAFLYDPQQPAAVGIWAEIEAAAPLLGMQPSKVPVRTAGEIETAIPALARASNSGVYVLASPATDLHRELIATLAQRHRLPVVHEFRYFVEVGGLASYGPDDDDLSRRAASYVDRILRGEKPRDLPVQLPTKFQLVINLKAAKALGLEIPPGILAIADEVIE
jgi:putative tryptophan/tyrosine transport system substrate-binding protein